MPHCQRGQVEVKDPQRYHISRKDMYALLGVAICDYHRRFTWFDITHASCTHDSTAFSATALGQDVVSGKLPYPYFLNGDAAFTLGPHMIIPSNNDPNLDDFDFYQSSNRMAIECAFGILVRRWGVLWRSLSVKFNRRAPLVGALMRLHNFCIDRRLMADSDMPDVQSSYAQVQPGRYFRTPRFDKDGRPVDFLDVRETDATEGIPVRASL